MVFERQLPSPEVCIWSENIVNNKVLARGPLSPIWCKLAPKSLPKEGLGPPLEAKAVEKSAEAAAFLRFTASAATLKEVQEAEEAEEEWED